MNTKEHEIMKMRGSADVSYLGLTVDQMIWDFMREQEIPGLTLAIVQAPYIPRVVGYGMSDTGQKRLASANTMWEDGAGSTWLAFPRIAPMAAEYGLADHPVAGKLQGLLEELVRKAGNIYS